MNLSILRKMITEGDVSSEALRTLIRSGGECEWLDFKENLNLDIEKAECDFVKDALAFKNVGGGYIVIGVKDKSWNPIGIQQHLGYDSKILRDKIRKHANVDLDVDLVHHALVLPNSGSTLFALIYIRSSKKKKRLRIPTLVGKDSCIKKPYGLRRGEIYARKGDSTVRVDSEQELEKLISDAGLLVDQDAIEISVNPSPFAIEDGTYRLLERGFENFIGRSKLRAKLMEEIRRDPRIWIVNVHGPGGVGKSALVNWAVYEFYANKTFEAIIHLTAKEAQLTPSGIESFGRSLYSLENLLNHILAVFEEPRTGSLEEKRKLVIEYLSAWETLLVLDNMETVQDGRILDFIQKLPPSSKAKVLMTSREKTGGWELPFPMKELNIEETEEFLRIKATELKIDFPLDSNSIKKAWEATGGLPLALQWSLGRYSIDRNFNRVVNDVIDKNSPVLEFSFRNIWSKISEDARATLATMAIFEEPPTSQQISIATEFAVDRIEKALSELCEVTLVTRNIQQQTGRVVYVSLPITLSFAQNQLSNMGGFELSCRQRYSRFIAQMSLQESELYRFQGRFQKFGIENDNEKRAAILCLRGESELFSGNVDNAEMLFKQARDLAPQSAYVLAMCASYEIGRNRIGNAILFIDDACRRATKRTGSLCYVIKARIALAQRDKNARIAALEKAIQYDPEDLITRHQYGVALSIAGRPEEAIQQFTSIIDKEKNRMPPSDTLLMALKTRIINYKRMNMMQEAKDDLNFANEIFSKYPHLAKEAEQFLDAVN